MEEDSWRRAAWLSGTKDFHGEADCASTQAVTRLGHDEPPAFTSNVAGPLAIHPAGGVLESRPVGLRPAARIEGHE